MNAEILVVDDETTIADLVEVCLKNEGYTVHKFYGGTDALACVRRQHLDLAILDVMLPDVDGFTLCQRIREAGHLFPGVTEVMVYHRTGSTALLSCTDWDESGPTDDGPLRTRETPLGTRFDVGTRCTVWRARWPWLAESVAALLRGGLEPAEGREGLWHGETGKGTVWLACRGDLVLRAATDLPLEADWPEELLAMLEQEEGT